MVLHNWDSNKIKAIPNSGTDYYLTFMLIRPIRPQGIMGETLSYLTESLPNQ